MKKNILVSALGAQADIIEETIGFVNYNCETDFYKDLANFAEVEYSRANGDFKNFPADELWLVATDKPQIVLPNGRILNSTLEDFEKIKNDCSKYVSNIKIFILEGVKDITNEEEARAYRSLAFGVIANARKSTNGGKLYLSLACGRKTMSADFQEAAYCFGCDTLIHILGDNKTNAYPLNLGSVSKNEALNYEIPAFNNEEVIYCKPETTFLDNINQQKKQTQHFYTSYYLNEKESRSNFHILYTLPPSKIEELKTDKIGIDRKQQQVELDFLKRLPKTDLHCHLGGVLSAEEMIEVAKCYIPKIETAKSSNKKFAAWQCRYDSSEPIKKWYNRLADELGVHKGLIASSLILTYEGKANELHNLIFRNYADEEEYKGIDIKKYEPLGDLQGSALLCNESAIRKTVQILLRNCKEQNVAYIEIRCSPINYQTDELSAEQVLNAIFEELEKETEIAASVIMIASRHGKIDLIDQSIALVQKMKSQSLFKKYFRGFDLAGDEQAKTPKEVREQFLEIMKDCYNITIHAGETAPSENIWEAVYYLTAERIGHGLKLEDNEDLMVKFLERGIGIEMCPSSNFQIVGYKDNYFQSTQNLKEYPLKKYLDNELKVSVNTDNPGISITNSTYELHRASRLTAGGLSKWDILQLICNGFRTAFYPYEQKKVLIRNVEKKIGELISKELL